MIPPPVCQERVGCLEKHDLLFFQKQGSALYGVDKQVVG